MNRVVLRSIPAAAAAAALVLSTVAPASAGSTKVRDGGDTKGAVDIRTLKLKHSKKKVRIAVKLRNLKNAKKQTLTTAVDTRKRGDYEYVSSIVLTRDPSILLFKVRKDGGLKKLRCKYTVSGSFKKDVIRTPIPRKCLGRPKRVRVGVVSGVKGKDESRDHAPGKGEYTRWVKRG